MNRDFKFRIGQTVGSPYGIVKIIDRWGKSSIFYDVRFRTSIDGELRGTTWTFEEHEMTPFSISELVDDNAVELIDVEEVDGDLIATFSVWIKVKIEGDFFFVEKQFKEKLSKE